MTQIISQCSVCTRFHKENHDGETCDAFPNGIPDEILWNEVSHIKAYPGDNGLRFEQEEGSFEPTGPADEEE